MNRQEVFKGESISIEEYLEKIQEMIRYPRREKIKVIQNEEKRLIN
ncbi:hypothetical protein M2454_000397 [Aequitasia blattaphilus]|uniref:Uncharacterized protein n=1 Tax=Aequitasia blattaphilus TaxID=2949332 RepID=A0ABT1E9M4_9FIRM|nr:hypothetical protein [Aequitasia blattaphilus]MCP1101212.1 hypothetical protein [Aequitasia blattaphilus]MCR8613852.1 hypothetical protein [Aequitasia blattaphilus]